MGSAAPGTSGRRIVIRLLDDGRGQGELEAARNSLRLWLSRESVGTGPAEVMIDRHQDHGPDGGADFKGDGGLWSELAYHVMDDTADAVGATIVAAVGSWLRHWWEARGASAVAQVVQRDGDEETVTTLGPDGRTDTGPAGLGPAQEGGTTGEEA